MTRFRPASPGDVDAILGMMRGYYAQDGYTFVEAEARAAALALIKDPSLGREALEIAEAYSSSTGAAASRTTAAT